MSGYKKKYFAFPNEELFVANGEIQGGGARDEDEGILERRPDVEREARSPGKGTGRDFPVAQPVPGHPKHPDRPVRSRCI